MAHQLPSAGDACPTAVAGPALSGGAGYLRLVDSNLSDLLESTPDAIGMVNSRGLIVLMNSQAEKLFGYSRDELLHQPVETLLPNRFREKHVGYRDGYTAQPHRRTMGAGLELYGLRKDGQQFPVEISLSPLKTEAGTLVMSAVRDVSGRHRAEKQFRELLESAPDAMVIVNSAGEIVLVNSQAETLFGYSREQLLVEVWGYRDGSGARTVDSHVRALRPKLGHGVFRGICHRSDQGGTQGSHRKRQTH